MNVRTGVRRAAAARSGSRSPGPACESQPAPDEKRGRLADAAVGPRSHATAQLSLRHGLSPNTHGALAVSSAVELPLPHVMDGVLKT